MMCGRCTVHDAARAAETYKAAGQVIEEIGARYNVAPSQRLPVIRSGESGWQGEAMRWGLVPFWDKSEKPKIAPINARAEEALEKATFKQALQRRRCLVIADGFYEWQRLSEALKTPFFIGLRDGRPFTIAGVFEEADEKRPATFALLTTGPNELMTPIHNRMPLILSSEDEKRWLEPGPITAEDLANYAKPYPAEQMQTFAVSRLVNNPRNDLPACVRPAVEEEFTLDGGPNSL